MPRPRNASVANSMNTGMKTMRTQVTMFAGVQMLLISFC